MEDFRKYNNIHKVIRKPKTLLLWNLEIGGQIGMNSYNENSLRGIISALNKYTPKTFKVKKVGSKDGISYDIVVERIN